MATVTGGRLGAEAPAAVAVPRARPAAGQSTFLRRLRRDKTMLLLAAPGVAREAIQFAGSLANAATLRRLKLKPNPSAAGDQGSA